jgi:hypothetical protein
MPRALYWVIGFLAAVLATSPSLFSVFIPIKVALVPVLFYAWGRHLPKVFQLGLFFAWVGDIALLWPEREALFMVGMGSFTLMWVSYGVGWSRLPRTARGIEYGLGAGTALLLGASIIGFLWPALKGPFRGLVPAYAIVLVGTSWTAVRVRDVVLWLGLLSFWVSDTLIAYMKFVAPVPYGDGWVMGLYAAGHGLMIARTQRVMERVGAR